MLYDEFRAMNTGITLAAEGDTEAARAGFVAARGFIDESEERFSRFRETSELTQLNRSAGSWFTASPALFEVVETALQLVDQTSGLFDPSILPALRQAGYDRSMDEMRAGSAAPAYTEEMIIYRTSIRDVRLDAQHSGILLPPGMALDLGGIAKGWIAEQVAVVLSGYTRACAVNAGGDLFLHGLPDGEPDWAIGLEDPRDPELSLGVLHVRGGAVATSSVNKRRWMQGDQPRHHLIDPRTGQPAVTPWLSVTVCASSAALAEVFAKALLIAGPEEAPRLLQRCPQLAYLAVDGGGGLWGSNHYQELSHVSYSSFSQ